MKGERESGPDTVWARSASRQYGRRDQVRYAQGLHSKWCANCRGSRSGRAKAIHRIGSTLDFTTACGPRSCHDD